MSKRARLTTEESKRAGLHAWETNDGRRWLMKSLNPNDVAISSTGIPSLSSRNISVLNWQGEFTMGVPANLNAEVPAYDTNVFLYQHPLIFAVSSSKPQGTIDMREFKGGFHLTQVDNADGGSDFIITVDEAQSELPITLSTCTRFLNKQVDPSAFGQNDSLQQKSELFKLLTQRSRICYGGATIIPTCSDQYNSGSLSVCQQVFNPRNTVLENYSSVILNTYLDNDFPDTADAVQNPQMYYGKFQDGAYVPYKLVEPLTSDYVNSEQAITTRCPYWVTNVAILYAYGRGTANARNMIVDNPTVALPEGKSGGLYMKFHIPQKVYNPGDATADPPVPQSGVKPIGVRFTIMGYTGQKGYFTMTLADNTAGKETPFFDNETTRIHAKTLQAGDNNQTARPWVEDVTGTFNYLVGGQEISFSLFGAASADVGVYFTLPDYWTFADIRSDNPLTNDWGTHFRSQDVPVVAGEIAEGDIYPDMTKVPNLGTIPPYNGRELVSITMSGVSNTAPIKMILRYGVEILLTASSIYSPFKFISPRYDESAIKSYARCIRNMKDAYFANAGSTVGQIDFVNKILNLIETDAPDDMRVLNQGGQWSGVVGTF